MCHYINIAVLLTTQRIAYYGLTSVLASNIQYLLWFPLLPKLPTIFQNKSTICACFLNPLCVLPVPYHIIYYVVWSDYSCMHSGKYLLLFVQNKFGLSTVSAISEPI